MSCRQVGSVLVVLCLVPESAYSQSPSPELQTKADPQSAWHTGRFQWRVGEPVISVTGSDLPTSPSHPWVAVKDPSLVRHGDRWHLFCTLRRQQEGDGRIRIGYISFDDWPDAQRSHWSLLELVDGYHAAPQIFYFRAHNLWYLIYQAGDPKTGLKYGPCFSTNADLSKPGAWTKPAPLFVVPEGQKAGLDYWVICDDRWAYLFYTTNDGKMWRARTPLSSFPNRDWSVPEIALTADIFEASHTYRIQGSSQYLTLIEAQAKSRRYFKAYLADSLDGKWQPISAVDQPPLVVPENVINQSQSWTTSYSHGEIIRAGFDERLEIRPLAEKLELVFQGANDSEMRAGSYGQIPWRLGLLKQQ